MTDNYSRSVHSWLIVFWISMGTVVGSILYLGAVALCIWKGF